jgi:hypothetical protein
MKKLSGNCDTQPEFGEKRGPDPRAHPHLPAFTHFELLNDRRQYNTGSNAAAAPAARMALYADGVPTGSVQ